MNLQTARQFGRASIGLAIAGFITCRYMHNFGRNDSTAPISVELFEGNLLAWLFIAIFAFLVSLSFAYQLMFRRWVHSIILMIGFAGIIVIAATEHNTLIHRRALTTTIVSLFVSTAIYALRCGPIIIAIIYSLLSAIAIAALVLVPTNAVATNPGLAEKLLFVFYAVFTVYFLNMVDFE